MSYMTNLLSYPTILTLLAASVLLVIFRLLSNFRFSHDLLMLWILGATSLIAFAQLFAESKGYSVGVLYFDRLSLVMLSFISFIGMVVYQYSIRYLHGEERQSEFMFALHGAILSAQLLVLGGNLLFFAGAWILVSLTLHILLTYYYERPRAVLAARKKFIISRLGDLALFISIAVLYFNFDTLQIEELFRISTGSLSSDQASALNLACLGFVLAAFCKSAQLPFHSWLPDTLECPTPVSALMHAGIINGGGYLLIRVSPLFVNAYTALNLLVVVGTLTAVFGVVVMWAQTTVKKSLAWSTVAQMGFMMVECGVGAYSIAIAHILGHGFYKANSFLLSGTSNKFILPKLQIRSAGSVFSWLTIGLIFSTFALAGGLILIGGKIATYPGGWVMAFVLCLALSQLFTIKSSSVYLGLLNRLCLAFILTGLALGLELILQATFANNIGAVSSIFGRGGVGIAVGVFACLGFLFLGIFSLVLPNVRDNELATRWRAHAINGFYLGIYADRLTARLFQKTA